MTPPSPPIDFASKQPDVRLFGKVDEQMLSEFFRQTGELDGSKPITLELSTTGGNADIGRRIALELRHWQFKLDREVYFIGKTFVYSAGVTIMASVRADHRYLSSDCEILIHERKIDKTLHLAGALRGCRSIVQDVLAEIDSGQRLERVGFAELVQGTSLNVDDLLAKVLERDWYLTADKAVELGLVAGIV